MSFQKLVSMTKNVPFFPILHVFAPLNDVHMYIAWSWKTTLITWIFYEDDIQLQIQVPPPPRHTWQQIQQNSLAASDGNENKNIWCTHSAL